ncbi:MAG: alkaline phosphatase family protein [Candidatus Binatia bacterium]
MKRSARILFLGLDAADQDLIFQWGAQGFLPVLSTLLARGVSGFTKNPPGLYTGAVWPSFHTGVLPGRHGRYFYRQLVPGTYHSAVVTSNNIDADSIWALADRAGLRVGVIDLPKAPLAARFTGLHVSEWGVHDPTGPLRTLTTSLASEVVRRFGRDPVGICDLYPLDLAGYRSLRDALLARIELKAKMLCHYLDQARWDLFMAAFADAHCAGHQFWALHDPTHPRHDAAVAADLGDPLRDIYVALDAAVGRVLERAGYDTTVFVLASHGMGAHYDGTFLLDSVLQRLEGEKPRSGGPLIERLQRSWHFVPGFLRVRLAPIADRVYDRLRATGRARRKAFVVPTNDNCAGIRFNVLGREPQGKIKPGAEYDAFFKGLGTDLTEIRNVETGGPLVHEILRSSEIFPGPHAHELPDMLVRWNRSAPVRVVSSSKIGTLAQEYQGQRTGDHRNLGLFISTGPGLGPSRLDRPVDVTDFAPTFASLLGIECGDVDGRPIGELWGKTAAESR